MKDLNENEKNIMKDAMREGIDSVFKNNVVKRVPRSTLSFGCEIQPLKCFLQIQRNIKIVSNDQY